MNKLDSIVIVKNDKGSVATIRFEDGKDDKILSSSNNSVKSKESLYVQIETHVNGVLNG